MAEKNFYDDTGIAFWFFLVGYLVLVLLVKPSGIFGIKPEEEFKQ